MRRSPSEGGDVAGGSRRRAVVAAVAGVAVAGVGLGSTASPALAATGTACGVGGSPLAAGVDPACVEATTVTIPLDISPTSLFSLFNGAYEPDGFQMDVPMVGSTFTVDSTDLHLAPIATGATYVVLNHPVAPGEYSVVQTVPPDGDYWPLGVDSPDAFDRYDPDDPYVATMDIGPWQDCQLGLWNWETFQVGRAARPAPFAEADTPFPPSWHSPGWTLGPFEDRKCVERPRPDGYGLLTVTGSSEVGISSVSVVDRTSGAVVATSSPSGSGAGLDLSETAPGSYDVLVTVDYSTAGTHTVDLAGQLLDRVAAQASLVVEQDVPCPPTPPVTPEPSPTDSVPGPVPGDGPDQRAIPTIGGRADGGVLPRTGSASGPWILSSVGLLGLGTVLLVAARRRTT